MQTAFIKYLSFPMGSFFIDFILTTMGTKICTRNTNGMNAELDICEIGGQICIKLISFCNQRFN
jgi:hypothetical protein